MSSHLKHHHARASQELAQPIVKAFTDDSSVGEHGCCPSTGKVVEGIVSHTYDVGKKTIPQYNAQAFKKHLDDFVDKHYTHYAEDDASKSDEKVIGEKNAEANLKAHAHDKMAHEAITWIKAEICNLNVHKFDDFKVGLREIGGRFKGHHLHGHLHERVDKFIHEVDEAACQFYERIKNDISELATYVGEEMDGLLTEVDDGATQALRKLVEQVAFEFMIQVVNKREKRKEKKNENEKYDFDFEGFVKLFEDTTHFYTDFDSEDSVELSKDTTNFYTDFDFKGFVKLFKDAANFKTDFDFEGFVELFDDATNFNTDFDSEDSIELSEDEDDYVMVDHNTTMPSATDDEVLATEVTEKAATKTRTWWVFRRS